MACYLFVADPEVAHYLNSKDKSPLFMAAEAGYKTIFDLMLKEPVPSDRPAEMVLMDRSKIALAAVWAKNRGNNPSVICHNCSSYYIYSKHKN